MIINKANIGIGCVADVNGTRPVLSGVYVNEECTVATDSYRLLEVGLPKEKHVHSEESNNEKPFIVDVGQLFDVAKDIKKKNGVFSDQVSTHCNCEKVTCSYMSNDALQERNCRVIEGTFPDYKRILPKGKPIAHLYLNAKHLKSMAEYFAKYEANGRVHAYVFQCPFNETEKVLYMTGETEHGQNIRGVLMPLRSNYSWS